MGEMQVLGMAAAAGLAAGLSVGHRAAQIGHEVVVDRSGKRFRIVCECGWSTHSNWTRRHAFEAVTAHVVEVVTQSQRGAAPNVGDVG